MVRPMRYTILAVSSVLVLLLMAPPLLADRIYFKNGCSLEGVVRKKDAAGIVVDVGDGTIVLSPQEVDRIEKATSAENTALEKELSSADIPSGATDDLNAAIQHMRNKKSLVSRFNMEKAGIDRKMKKKESELMGLYKEYKKKTASITALTQTKKVISQKEKKIIIQEQADITKLNGTIKEKEFEMKTFEREQGMLYAKRAEAVQALTEAVADVSSLYEKFVENNPAQASSAYAKQVKEIIDEFYAGWKNIQIPLERRGSNFIVQVRLNGKKTVPLIVDTGASTVYISRAVAKAIGITEQDVVQTVNSRLADGSSAAGDLVVLSSVEVGGMKATNVRAVVMTTAPNEDVGGLLGMTYLSNYECRIDARANVLILKQFEGK